ESVRQRWDLSDPAEYERWTREGEGLLGSEPVAAGDFVMGVSGSVVDRVLPGGTYSDLLSSKHRAFLASAPFRLDGEYDLYLNVAGDGSSARYAVQHYPRRGTVYPVTNLKDGDWEWVPYKKIDYWNGDDIHIELATAGEAPILVSGKRRSWFGIREAILVEKGSPLPTRAKEESLLPLFSNAEDSPKTLEEAVTRIAATLKELLVIWGTPDRNLTDPEALFLDEMVSAGFLPNTIEVMPPYLESLVRSYQELEKGVPEPIRAPGLVERPGRDEPLFIRGNHKEPGEPVARRFLESIDPTPYNSKGSGRLELAQDFIREDNPFTTRIIVNRVWNHLFGNGLVSTVDNFGRLGEKPSHPELLDYLAVRFREEQGWSLRSLIRDLVLSETWQQASAPSEKALSQDPENRLLSHFTMRRLEAEAIRDSMLSVSGTLESGAFGEPVAGSTPRRSVYVQVRRNSLDPLMTTFDFPVPASTVGRRSSTNVPAQSLTLLNDRFIIGQAQRWADRLRSELPDETNDDARIHHLFASALNRPPTEREVTGARDFLYAVDQDHVGREEQFTELENERNTLRSRREEILAPTQERLLAARREKLSQSGGETGAVFDFGPVASWEFEGDVSDAVGGLSGSLVGSARIEGGAVVFDGNGFVRTEAFPQALREKTLEVVVQLSTLDQRGAGVMTVQDLKGHLFDSIVFAERKPQEWLAGSNNHTRTLDFTGEQEAEAMAHPVHLVMTFEKDGTIRAYREGEPYGKSTRKAPLQEFASGQSQIVFGLRHGTTASGNKPLRGKIFEARLYDRALAEHEVKTLASGDPLFVTEGEVIESLTESQESELKEIDASISGIDSKLEQLRELGSDIPLERRRWQDLAHAIFNLKEFIYLR
ncbi:MAG: DUF1553 domain-containing protein, partial [Verrucomicrobiota bacterium]